MVTDELRNLIPLIIGFPALGSASLMVLGLATVAATLARRLRKEFEKDWQYQPLSPWLFWTACVATCCVFKSRSNNKYMYPYFRGFNVCEFANLFERVSCFITIYSAIILMILGTLAYVSDFLLGTNIVDYQ